ncbi:unnamed protein product [Ambrosiozyma monospora]|uniref:Unnamed protein product n=1 Tax=Ambrosiozyma monospora TaxID=43982 RepID=A0ACB5T5J5_AMBMO|nr:unnamed protein product [Ambrosiozyma monospora]
MIGYDQVLDHIMGTDNEYRQLANPAIVKLVESHSRLFSFDTNSLPLSLTDTDAPFGLVNVLSWECDSLESLHRLGSY